MELYTKTAYGVTTKKIGGAPMYKLPKENLISRVAQKKTLGQMDIDLRKTVNLLLKSLIKDFNGNSIWRLSINKLHDFFIQNLNLSSIFTLYFSSL